MTGDLEESLLYGEIVWQEQGDDPKKTVDLPLATAKNLITKSAMVSRLLLFTYQRTPNGLTLTNNSEIFYIDLKPDDMIVGYEQEILVEEQQVNVRIYVATAWEQFTDNLDWKRRPIRRFNLRIAEFGLLLRQDGEWYNMEGLLAHVLQPELDSP